MVLIFDSVRDINLHGKSVFVTGGNNGIGFETAKELAIRGAHVTIGCRSEEKMITAITAINAKIQELKSQGKVNGQILDLESFDSVRKAAKEIHEKMEKIDICILNAGIMKVPFRLSEGIEIQQKVNHFSHFLFLNSVMSLIEKAEKPRVISLSSAAHQMGAGNLKLWRTFESEEEYKKLKLPDSMGSWVPYGESKLANVGHMLQLSKLKPNIQCFAVHPGVVKTGLAEPWKNNWPWTFSVIGPVMNLFLKSSFEGAQTSIFCAISKELEDKKFSGKYFSDCAKTTTKTMTDELAEKLWKISEELTKSTLPK